MKHTLFFFSILTIAAQAATCYWNTNAAGQAVLSVSETAIPANVWDLTFNAGYISTPARGVYWGPAFGKFNPTDADLTAMVPSLTYEVVSNLVATAAPGVNTNGSIVISQSALETCIKTNAAAYSAFILAQKAEFAGTNYARLLTLYNAIPDARSNYTAGRSLLVTVDASLASGTNNTAQLVARMRQMVNVQSETIRYLNGLTELIQRLGPVLKAQYRPEEDTTQ